MRPRPLVVSASVGLALAGVGLTAAPASAASRSCDPVRGIFAGTSDEADLTSIRATNLRCSSARAVARGAWRFGARLTVTSPVRTYSWRGWRVRGDLRGNRDSYTARKGTRTVTWRV